MNISLPDRTDLLLFLQRLTLVKGRKSHLDLAENTGVTRKPLASSKPRSEEDEFWSTPAAPTRALKFSGENMLMDEKADFGNISAISFTDGPTPRTVTGSLGKTVQQALFPHADSNLNQSEATITLADVSPKQPSISTQDPPENDPTDTDSEAHHSPADQATDAVDVKASDHETVRGVVITKAVEVIVVCL